LSREVGGENFAFLSEILLACFGDELARRTQHWPPRRRSHFLLPEDQQTEFLRRAIVHSAKMVKINLNSVTGVNC
jgi:hypothetical protein